MRARLGGLVTEGDQAGLEKRARARDDKAVARALRILERRAQAPGLLMGDAVTCGSFFRLRLGGEVREHFEVAFLNRKNCLIAVERLFSGTIDGAQISPRIVAQRALALNAAAAIVAHNHPSGDPEPSEADRLVTTQLRSVLRMVDVTLLDHFVITSTGAVSLAARGVC
ncbi:JAB domain-containing protein [Stenotrophomonas sp. Sa5BUN4]|uniref:JAB domain-containing protein n=2 Tax=Stenotrophomonas lacuserhaii TaxID=2760084 RepID=A0A8X8FUY4_9GAMM|nr:JAB domain-containing protein [Stenotrophomonas pennii]